MENGGTLMRGFLRLPQLSGDRGFLPDASLSPGPCGRITECGD